MLKKIVSALIFSVSLSGCAADWDGYQAASESCNNYAVQQNANRMAGGEEEKRAVYKECMQREYQDPLNVSMMRIGGGMAAAAGSPSAAQREAKMIRDYYQLRRKGYSPDEANAMASGE